MSSSSDEDIGVDPDTEVSPVNSEKIDITVAEPYEVKRIYSELLDTCRGFEDGLLNDKDSDDVLNYNITNAGALFRQIETSMSESLSANNSPIQPPDSENRKRGGKTVGELYLAYLHTNRCSTMLKHRAKNAGAFASTFGLDTFLTALRQTMVDEEGGYSVSTAVRKLAFTAACVGKCAPGLETMVGTCDFEKIAVMAPPPPPKEKKARAARKNDTEGSATQKEVVNKDRRSSTEPEVENDTPEGLATNVLRTVKEKFTQAGDMPPNLLEVAKADDLPDFLSRAFGVAFLVRDGRLALTLNETPASASEVNQGIKSEILLNPAEKTPQPQTGNTEMHRQQTIVSFSAAFLKEYLNAANQ